MKPLLALALAAQLSGCATSWFIVQGTGTQSSLDEDNHEVSVPQPDFTEHLSVRMPVATAYQMTPGVNGGPAVRGAELPFKFACSRTQIGQNQLVRHSYRYGSRWKKTAIIAVLLEGAISALGLLSASQDKPDGYLYGGYFALDALLTLPLIFIPRKEISAESRVTVTTPLDDSCPEGLAVELAGQSYPINAAGRVSADAERVIAQWRTNPNPSDALEVSFAGQRRELRLYGGVDPSVELAVPPGTLTR